MLFGLHRPLLPSRGWWIKCWEVWKHLQRLTLMILWYSAPLGRNTWVTWQWCWEKSRKQAWPSTQGSGGGWAGDAVSGLHPGRRCHQACARQGGNDLSKGEADHPQISEVISGPGGLVSALYPGLLCEGGAFNRSHQHQQKPRWCGVRRR